MAPAPALAGMLADPRTAAFTVQTPDHRTRSVSQLKTEVVGNENRKHLDALPATYHYHATPGKRGY